MKHLTRRVFAATLASAAVLAYHPVQAQQDYPNRTIRLVVPFTAGGGGDALGRVYAEKLSEALKVPVIVDNRPGGGTIIGSNIVAKAEPDGYTMLLNVSLLILTPFLHSKMPYDALADLTPVTDIASTPNWLAVSTRKTKARTVKELVEDVKARPKDFNYGSLGNGSSGHLLGLALEKANGLSMLHVPYKGSAAGTLALISGEIAITFADLVTLKPQVDAGTVRLLASTGTERSGLTPDVPTLAELGYTGFESLAWAAVFVPSKVPAGILNRLETATRKMMTDPELISKWRALGFEPGGQPQAQFAAQLRADSARWGDLIEEAGIKKVD